MLNQISIEMFIHFCFLIKKLKEKNEHGGQSLFTVQALELN